MSKSAHSRLFWRQVFKAVNVEVMHIGCDNMKAEYLMDGVKLEHVNDGFGEFGESCTATDNQKQSKNNLCT